MPACQHDIADSPCRGARGPTGIALASGLCGLRKGWNVKEQDNLTPAPISNWTRATGTTPHERPVFPEARQPEARREARDATS